VIFVIAFFPGAHFGAGVEEAAVLAHGDTVMRPVLVALLFLGRCGIRRNGRENGKTCRDSDKRLNTHDSSQIGAAKRISHHSLHDDA